MTDKLWETGRVMKLNFRKEILRPRSSNFSLRNRAYWFQNVRKGTFEDTVRPISRSEVSYRVKFLNRLFETALFHGADSTLKSLSVRFWWKINIKVKIGHFRPESNRIFIPYNRNLLLNLSLEQKIAIFGWISLKETIKITLK